MDGDEGFAAPYTACSGDATTAGRRPGSRRGRSGRRPLWWLRGRGRGRERERERHEGRWSWRREAAFLCGAGWGGCGGDPGRLQEDGAEILADRLEGEIYTTLCDCGMDPDIAVERLISQGKGIYSHLALDSSSVLAGSNCLAISAQKLSARA
jgi:hypothetical protein